MTGTGKDPTTCRNTPEQRRYQLVYQRARGRAVTELIARHKDEYEHLFQMHRAEVEAETEQIDQAAKEKADHDHGGEPARLKTGRRAKGQQVVDRIDVARCPHCIRHHDRGHVCAVCGAAPGHSVSSSRRPASGAGKQASKPLASVPFSEHETSKKPQVRSKSLASDQILESRNQSDDRQVRDRDRLSESPRRARHTPRVYDGLGLPRRPPPNIDPAALAEFNAGVERARKAARR